MKRTKTHHATGHAGGFTLFEAVLSLALSVVLMGLVGFAIRFYARDMANSDVEVRRMQLVTAVMQMIEDDLRSTLHSEPVDTSGLEALLSASGGGGDTGGETGTDESASATDATLPPEDTATVDLSSGTSVLETPGLMGNQFQIQFDVSRLPRLEEYITVLDGDTSDMTDVPSDIKTVSYFVQAAGTVTGVSDEMNSIGTSAAAANANGGLVRRAVDRAVTAYAVNNGNVGQLMATGDVLAPEVTSIEFAYWDGFLWQIQWDSDELGELPLAIRVTIAISEMDAPIDPALATTEVRQFQHVVRLPMARPIEDESLTEAAI